MGLTKYILAVVAGYIGFLLIDRFDPASIAGKRVVITGASTGIGEEVAYQYARLGARVLITARREAVLQQVVAKCKELGAKEAFYLPLDMAKQEDTKRLIDEAKMRFGGLDHLILNHITEAGLAVWTGDLEKLRKVMDINFHAYVSLASYATPMLAERKGSIAVVSSFAGKVGMPFIAAYSASKFALHGFFDALRQEFRMQNIDISVTTFVLGAINTTNAAENSQEMIANSFRYTSPSSTAYRIMTGTSNREREVYYPVLQTLPAPILRDLAPRVMEAVVKGGFKQEALDEIARNPPAIKDRLMS